MLKRFWSYYQPYQRLFVLDFSCAVILAILEERERGLLDKLASAGITRFIKCYGDFTISNGFAAMKDILREFRPEAVFCGNDDMAAGALKCLHESGIRVPDDVAVVGYEDNDLCTGLVPSLLIPDCSPPMNILHRELFCVSHEIDPPQIGTPATGSLGPLVHEIPDSGQIPDNRAKRTRTWQPTGVPHEGKHSRKAKNL